MRELSNCHSTGMGTLQWQVVRTGRICSTLAGPTGLVFVLCSLLHGHWLSVGVGSRRGARGGAQCRLLLAYNCFLLWCNQHSLILFDIFFFSLLFVVAIFHVFTVLAVFSPRLSPAPPSPVIYQKPETRNPLGCKGLLVGHWSPAVASSSHHFQAVNPTQAARAILRTSPLPLYSSPWKHPQQA